MNASQKELSALITAMQSNECLGAMLDDIASREKHHKSVTVERQMERLARRGHSFTRAEIVGSMKCLQNFGLSIFVIGRRGAASRMEWMS
jgi:hypothetical protein